MLLCRLSKDNSSTRANVEGAVTAFAVHRSFQNRLLFIDVCEHLMHQLDQEEFDAIYLPKLLAMQHDAVPNVRFRLAQFATNCVSTSGNLHVSEDYKSALQSLLQALSTDKDRDVRYLAEMANKVQ